METQQEERLMAELLKEAEHISTVDTHQHLFPESGLVTDLVRLIVKDNYVCGDLVACGLAPEKISWLEDPGVSLTARWNFLLPYWKKVQYGSYAQVILLTVNDLYQGGGLKSCEKVEAVSSLLLQEYKKKGLFHRVFFRYCHIDKVLTQGSNFAYEKPEFYWVFRPLDRADFSPGGLLEQDCAAAGISLRTAEDLPVAMEQILKNACQRGAVGFKAVAMNWRHPEPEEIKQAWASRGQKNLFPGHPFLLLYLEQMAKVAGKLNIPVAVHTGAPWTNWLDYRQWEATGLIPLFLSFPETKFDLYHAGIPYGDQASLLAKTFPNVWHNLTWAHIISPEMAKRCISVWLETVPVNKVSAFGGDYTNETVVLTYGHLVIARRNLTEVLARRIRKGLLDRDGACYILKSWFSENPRCLYRLPQE